MANVLTDLAADIYKAADIVGRELVGFIPASTVNSTVEEVAVGQTVRAHFTRSVATATYTPAMTIPEGTDQTIDNKTMTLTKQKGVQIPWTGEDIRFVNGGSGFETIYGDQIAQAMRALVNEIETDLATEAYKNACRAVGTAGTTPFASNINTLWEARQILADNGMPVNDGRLSLVMDTAAGVKLRSLTQLQKVNEAGDTSLLRRGILLELGGFMLRESAKVQAHTRGTAFGASPDYLTDTGSTYAVGDTTIHLDTGSGTHVAGDVITFAGDANKYVIGTGAAGNGDKDIVLNGPGLRETLADGVVAEVGDSYTANVAFHQSALELAMRAPANPVGGDAATDRMLVQDPVSGLVFEIAVYKGFKKQMIFVGAVWGYKAWKPDAIALLLG